MSTKLEILAVLNERPGEFVSGERIASALNVSRNSVWKAVRALNQQGYCIESKGRCGYRLAEKRDVLSAEEIEVRIGLPCRVRVLESVDSTNNYAKATTDLAEPLVVLAERQTGGRGRLGRSFYSPAGAGLYMSIALSSALPLDKAMLVTIVSSLAVCRALKAVAKAEPEIKWVNDVYVGGRKVCGILTEAESGFETGLIEKVVAGIGVNCFPQEFPPEIAEKAGFVGERGSFTRNELAAAIGKSFFELMGDLDRRAVIAEYKSLSLMMNKPILIYNAARGGLPENGGRGIRAIAVDIDENGGLVVEYDEPQNGRLRDTLTGGEVTIRSGE